MSKREIDFHYEIHQNGKHIETRKTYFDLTDNDLKAIIEHLLEDTTKQTGLFADLPQDVLDKIHGEAVDDARNHVEGNISDYTIVLEKFAPMNILYLLPDHILKNIPDEAFNDPEVDDELAALRAEYL